MDDLTEKTTKQYLDLLRDEAPKSLSCFVEYMTPDEPPASHHEFFAEKLEAIEQRELMRATFSCPPGHAKTKFFSRYFPAWYLGRHPNHRFLQGGHSQHFAENEFGKHVRDIILDPKFQHVFPQVRVNAKSSAAGNWRIANNRGGYVTKGVGQSIAGYRGHVGGIDDPFGSREDAHSEQIRKTTGDWLFTDFRTRLLPHSPLYIVATRWHPDDLIGRVEELSRKGQVTIPWTIYNLPAIIETEEEMALDPMGRSIGEALWPEYYSYAELMEIKATIGASDWLALYKGTPRNPEGTAVKSVWFQRYDQLPVRADEIVIGNEVGPDDFTVRPRLRRVVVSVDCAQKATKRSNYTVATVWMEDHMRRHYLADVVRKKMEFTEMVTTVETLAIRWGADAILVEEAGAGIQYLQTRAGKACAPIIGIKTNNKSKEFRFEGVTPMFEAGQVFLPRRARWLTAYETELLSFPSDVDDQVDSTSQYLTWARPSTKYGSRRLKGTRHR